MYKFKRDGFQKSRGGTSRILDVSCDHCHTHVAFYQKDGPGILKRMYVDRFIDSKPASKELHCPKCDRFLGVRITWEKEQRAAYRLFAGSVAKKIISQAEFSKRELG
jgi:hypothetical protein